MKIKLIAWIVLLVVGSTLLGVSVSAQPAQYELLEPLPGTHEGGSTTAGKYIPGIVKFVIGAAGVLAVLKIMYGGVLYMSTDAIGGKSEAKGHIQNALWGLLLIVSSYLILHTINPNLVTINLTISGVRTGTPFSDTPYDPPEIEENDFFAGCYDCNIMDIGIYRAKPVGEGCARVNPLNNATTTQNICLVNRTMNNRLRSLVHHLNDKDVSIEQWRVTEGYPPSPNPRDPSTPLHASRCHNPQDPPGPEGGGTCVDLAFIGTATAEQIKALFESVNAIGGMSHQYEVPSDDRKSEIISSLNALYSRKGWFEEWRNLRDRYASWIKDNGAAEHLHLKVIP